jgi:hypothetical protein
LEQALEYGALGLDFVMIISESKSSAEVKAHAEQLKVLALAVLKQSEPTNLAGMNLKDNNLRWTDLRGADLRGADLRRADLGGADLRLAQLSGANLSETNLSGANLFGANLKEANLEFARVNSFTYIDKRWRSTWWWHSLKYDEDNDASTPLCEFINW